VEANCAVVIDAHTARGVVNAGHRIAAISAAGPEALAQAQAELNAISAGESSQIEDMRAVMTKVMDGISRRYNSDAEHFGLPVGISRLDTLLGGLSPA
jgi:replicative DNA helicase